MKNIQRTFCIVFCLFMVLYVRAQEFIVTGKVIDNEGLEAIGANVTVKGSKGIGTITGLVFKNKLFISIPSFIFAI